MPEKVNIIVGCWEKITRLQNPTSSHLKASQKKVSKFQSSARNHKKLLWFQSQRFEIQKNFWFIIWDKIQVKRQ